MKINLLVISHFLIGWTNISTSQVMMWIWIPTLNLIFSMIRYLNLERRESSPNVKLSYPLNPGLANIFLLNTI